MIGNDYRGMLLFFFYANFKFSTFEFDIHTVECIFERRVKDEGEKTAETQIYGKCISVCNACIDSAGRILDISNLSFDHDQLYELGLYEPTV